MKRLIAWKNDAHRKAFDSGTVPDRPGKSWLVKEFGRTQFESMAYVSLENNEAMDQLFPVLYVLNG